MSGWNGTNGTRHIRSRTWRDIAGAGGMAALDAPSLLLYCIMLTVIRTEEQYRGNPYFVIVASLGIADCIQLAIILGYSVPASIIVRRIGSRAFEKVVGFILIAAWYASMPHYLALAVNRYVNICRKHSYKTLFSIRKTIGLAIGCWAVGFIIAFPFATPCCDSVFYVGSFHWGFGWGNGSYYKLSLMDSICGCLSAILVLIINGNVFYGFRKLQNTIVGGVGSGTNNSDEKRKREREFKLFVQFFIVTLWFLVLVVFYNLPTSVIGSLRRSRWYWYFVNQMYIWNLAANAWVYFTLNQSMRRDILRRLCFRRAQPSDTSTAALATISLNKIP